MNSILELTKATGVKLAVVGIPLLVGASGTVAAHGGGGIGGGMMGGGWGGMGGLGGLGLFGGGMFLWPLLLIGLVLAVVYGVGNRGRTDQPDRVLTELRERYARGDLSDEEFEARKTSFRQ